jgi:hypothetical protein
MSTFHFHAYAKLRLCVDLLCFACFASSVAGEEYRPELFQSLKLIYEDDFSSGKLDTNHWQIRQGSTWVVKDSVLVGGPSPKEYQDKKGAEGTEGDKAHAGFIRIDNVKVYEGVL